MRRAGEDADNFVRKAADSTQDYLQSAIAKASAAAVALRAAADGASTSIPSLPAELTGLLTDYANNYRDLAAAVDSGQRGDNLNTLASRGDELSDSIRAACPTS